MTELPLLNGQAFYYCASASATTPDHTLAFGYDLADHLTSSADAFHDYAYSRDGLSRVTSMTQYITGLALSSV